MRCIAAWLVLLVFFLPVQPAYAWGREGHAIIMDIALDHLSPDARWKAERLLGQETPAAASNWADQVLPVLPETGPWHYVNIPSKASGYLASRDCPDGDCAVAKILWLEAVLSQPRQSAAARRVAFKFLIHLVGDLHQPFHALADARGGNDLPVSVFGARQCGRNPCELHEVWDSILIAHTGLTERQYAAALETMIVADHLEAGADDPVQWANRSFELAQNALVEPAANIDEAYYNRERPVVDRQLALAGLRLAAVLNRAWTQEPAR